MKEHNLFLIYLTNDAQGIYGAFIGVSRVKTKELLQKAGALLPGVGGESKVSTLKGFVFLHKFHLLGGESLMQVFIFYIYIFITGVGITPLRGTLEEVSLSKMCLNVCHCLRC